MTCRLTVAYCAAGKKDEIATGVVSSGFYCTQIHMAVEDGRFGPIGTTVRNIGVARHAAGGMDRGLSVGTGYLLVFIDGSLHRTRAGNCTVLDGRVELRPTGDAARNGVAAAAMVAGGRHAAGNVDRAAVHIGA